MARDLVEHMVKKANAGRQFGHARAVKIDLDGDLGFGRFTADFGNASSHGGLSEKQLASKQKEKATKQGGGYRRFISEPLRVRPAVVGFLVGCRWSVANS